MGEAADLWDKIKRYYVFDKKEIRALIITVIVVGFIISFKDWGIGQTVNVKLGLFNLFNAIVITSLALLVKLSFQRIMGLIAGLKVEYRMWSIGLGLGLIVSFISNGGLWLLFPGSIIIHHMAGHRLGFFRYDVNYFGLALVSVMGPVGNLFLAILFKFLSIFVSSPLIEKAIILNIVLALLSMLPIPPLDGSKVFYGSRMMYAFSVVTITICSILLLTKLPILVSVIGSIFVGAVALVLFYVFVERFNWQGNYPKI